MPASVVIKDRFRFGNGTMVIADVTMDDSYPTGGEEVLPAKFGLTSLSMVQAAPSGGYVLEYDHANKKLKAYYGDYDAVADGALIEVAAAANLSAVIARVIAIGR